MKAAVKNKNTNSKPPVIPNLQPRKPYVPNPSLKMEREKEKIFIYEATYTNQVKKEKTTQFFETPVPLATFNGMKLSCKRFVDTDLNIIKTKLEAEGWKAVN